MLTKGRPLRILFTSFGWRDPGGGTILPYELAAALTTRGHQLAVLFAGIGRVAGPAYAVRRAEADGVLAVGIYNRPSPILDVGRPDRDLNQGCINSVFTDLIDEFRPDVIHIHNLHNLGASLLMTAASRARVVFTPHNLWVICARAHLETGERRPCAGADDRGTACARCARDRNLARQYAQRNSQLREAVLASVDVTLAVSHAAATQLRAWGLPPSAIRVVRQSLPWLDALWEGSGTQRVTAASSGAPFVPRDLATIGSARTHKGLLIAAAATAAARQALTIHGEPSRRLRSLLDEIHSGITYAGAYRSAELGGRLRPVGATLALSTVFDLAPFSVMESLASGVPVLGSRTGGIPELVEHEVNGLVVEPGSVEEAAAAIMRVAHEPDLLARLTSGIRPPRPWVEFIDDIESVYRGGYVGHEPAEPALVDVMWSGASPPGLAKVVGDRFGVRVIFIPRRGDAVTLPRPPLLEVRSELDPNLEARTWGSVLLVHPPGERAAREQWVRAINRIGHVLVPTARIADEYVRRGVPPARVVVAPCAPAEMDDKRWRALLREVAIKGLARRADTGKGPT